MVIVVKISFWIKKPFRQSILDAVAQFKQQHYEFKLMGQITPDSVASHEKDLVAFLYNQVVSI